MDSPSALNPHTTDSDDSPGPAHAVLAEVTCTWLEVAEGSPQLTPTSAVILHVATDMVVLEAADPRRQMPALGTLVEVSGETLKLTGRLAEHARNGRFLVCVGDRPVRLSARLRVSLPGNLCCSILPGPVQVEIADLTTSGARVRGVELPTGTQLTLDFTPPGRDQSVTVRAVVAHGTLGAEQPWIGLVFRLVALRGGR